MSHNLMHSFLLALKIPRWRRALLAAVVSDALGFGFALIPPVQWLLDGFTALILFAMLGFRWPLLSALAIEAVPGMQLFPAWTLVVAALASTDTHSTPQGTGVAEQAARPVQKLLERRSKE